ncbi:hypothetical protein [Microbacterium sp. SD291]|uniref:hypothetical protein n=1 Tax=Microbacterium sp. SD291 TaxID=2782007 RepID=UPI001A97CA05|nr:hypothetical protein [Microbacterium sp. SD291]MBO0981212.1 hypothetical protein [Microbacterium sp. SD291]
MGTTRTPIGTDDIPADAARDALRPWSLDGWNLRKAPLVALDTSGTADVHALAAVIRDDPLTGSSKSLGVIGNHNRPIQNEEHAELLMRIIGARRLDLVDAGYIGDGHEVFLVCELPAECSIDRGRLGAPRLDGPFELVSINHHDGSGALWFYVLPAGTWHSTLSPMLAPLAQRQPGTRWIARHALASARVRHNASLRGIAGKLRRDLGLFRRGEGPLATL